MSIWNNGPAVPTLSGSNTPVEGFGSDEEYRKAHARPDTDAGPNSLHHTIGIGEWQAASGAELERAKTRIGELETSLDDAEALIGTLLVGRRRYATLRKDSAQNIPDNTITKISFNDVSLLGQGMSVSAGAVTVDTEGIYNVSAAVRFVNNATGSRQILIYVDGSPYESTITLATSLNTGSVTVAGQVKCNVGSVVEIRVLQTSGGTLGLTVTSLPWVYFNIAWAHPL